MNHSKKENGQYHQKEGGEKNLVRVIKSIVVSSDKSSYIDQSVIRRKFYHSMNYSNLPELVNKSKFSIGVTSPGKGDGKTLTAANLAVSFALSFKKTVLIDLNMTNPTLHEVFGTNLRPGLVESFRNGSVFLSRTKIDNLYLLPAGRHDQFSFGFDNLLDIREVLYTLENEFDIVIADMNSVLPIDDFPAVWVNNLDGLILVIDTQKTKYAEIERVFNHIRKEKALGFVFNNVEQ